MSTYNIQKSKIKRQPEKPFNQFASLPALVKQHWRDTLLKQYKGYPTHVCYTSNWKLSHIICKKRGGENESKSKEGQKCGSARFSLSLFFLCVCAHSSKKPPTLHHVGRNQSQTGTYLWTLLLPEKNSSYIEKSPLNVWLIHHSKAIGFETEAARLWFGNTLCFLLDPHVSFPFNFFSLK